MRVPALSFIAAALALAGAVAAAPVRYSAPPETASLAPGPNRDLAQANCSVCHSVDYITTQPRDFKDPPATWTAEVAKMRKVYGARLSDEDAAKIVEYLAATYGR